LPAFEAKNIVAYSLPQKSGTGAQMFIIASVAHAPPSFGGQALWRTGPKKKHIKIPEAFLLRVQKIIKQ
jgi:hypothetical protein